MPTQLIATSARFDSAILAPPPPKRGRIEPGYPRNARCHRAGHTWGLLILAVMLQWALGGASAQADDWTNLEGTKTIQGDFLGMWENKVVLRLTNGSKVAIEMNQLNAVSRLHAEDLAEEQQERRQQRITELSAAPAEIVAPMPTATAAKPYQPLPADADLETTIHHTIDQIRSGHPRVLWDALPATHQIDVQTLVQQFFEPSQAEPHATILALLDQLARTLHKQRDSILGYPLLAALPPETLTKIQTCYAPVVGILAALGDAETFSLENLRSGDLSTMIDRFDSAAGPHIATLLETLADNQTLMGHLIQGGPVTIEMDDESRGSLTMTSAEGVPVIQPFALVEGRWLPLGMAHGWKQRVGQFQQQIAQRNQQAVPSDPSTSLALTTIGAILTRIEQATTQEEFNSIVNEYVSLLTRQIGAASNGFQNGPGMSAPTPYGPAPAFPPGQPGPGVPPPGGLPSAIPDPGATGPGATGPGAIGPGAIGPGA